MCVGVCGCVCVCVAGFSPSAKKIFPRFSALNLFLEILEMVFLDREMDLPIFSIFKDGIIVLLL